MIGILHRFRIGHRVFHVERSVACHGDLADVGERIGDVPAGAHLVRCVGIHGAQDGRRGVRLRIVQEEDQVSVRGELHDLSRAAVGDVEPAVLHEDGIGPLDHGVLELEQVDLVLHLAHGEGEKLVAHELFDALPLTPDEYKEGDARHDERENGHSGEVVRHGHPMVAAFP